ncbi:MAG: stage IV sporulation protein A, partial [Oscillospiraceae bacterium]|nr:stage IV sporulation protein A [Oscillospiraceae bacterium]
EIPFNMAAEIGTQKVITEHSTIGLVVTTDGSISDIPREEYEEAEERVIAELRKINKPFVVMLNCQNPNSKESKALSAKLSEKYGVPVIAVNCIDLDGSDIKNILTHILYQFPIKEICVNMPKWILNLSQDHPLKKEIFCKITEMAKDVIFVDELKRKVGSLTECEYIENAQMADFDLGRGSAVVSIEIRGDLFYKVLCEETGIEIESEADLMPTITELAKIKREYEKVKSALDEVQATGYGIVMPALDELTLEEPEIVKQGGKYGVRLKASAPSIHMMRADITTEVSPTVGSEKQSEELVMFLLKEFEENPKQIWQSNIFGKSLHELVNEGLHNKLYRMPSDARLKLQETIERIINEGCSGLICIIL